MLTALYQANVNAPVFQRIIELRDKAARLVGFENHAAFRISGRMAKTPTRVNTMLQEIRDLTEDGVRADTATLLSYKKKDCEERGAPFDGKLRFWDRLFCSRLRRSKEFSVDEVATSQYFPAEPTFGGMLKVFEELFGFVFVRLSEFDRARISPTGKSENIAWHPDPSIYSVWDDDEAGGGFCGYLYLDLQSRDNKYSHDACFTLQSGFMQEDGSEFYLSTVLICNLPKPSAAKPALLKHNDVVTIFQRTRPRHPHPRHQVDLRPGARRRWRLYGGSLADARKLVLDAERGEAALGSLGHGRANPRRNVGEAGSGQEHERGAVGEGQRPHRAIRHGDTLWRVAGARQGDELRQDLERTESRAHWPPLSRGNVNVRRSACN